MSSKGLLQDFLKVLKRIEAAEDIAQNREVVNTLVGMLTSDPTNYLREFAIYLQLFCGLSPKVIGEVAEGLMMRTKALGAKIILLWLRFKIYEILDIHTNAKMKGNDQKRRKVANTFFSHNFSGSNLESLFSSCCAAIEFDADKFQDQLEIITENHGSRLEQAFPKKPNSEVIEHSNHRLEQNLKDLIEDYKILPNGSLEKELQHNMIFTYIKEKSLRQSKIAKESVKSMPQSDFEYLQEAQAQQYISISSDMKNLLEKAEENENIFEKLAALKSRLFSIDVLKLERLVHKAYEVKMLIQNKDILLVIGSSGSGKTTSILKFLGYDFKNEQNGLSTIGSLSPEHLALQTSSTIKFCTETINAAAIPNKMYHTNALGSKKEPLVICDIPEFGDGGGVQMDIANTMGIMNALYGARTVRVLLIVSYDQLKGDLEQTTKKNQNISNFFRKSYIIKEITVYFTKVPSDKIASVPSLVERQLEHLIMTKNTNQNLNALTKKLIQSSKQKENFIDPLTSNYKMLLSNICLVPGFKNMNGKFHYKLTEETKREISQFIEREKNMIKELLDAGNFKMMHFHLQMIEKLMNILYDNDEIKKSYDQLVEYIKESGVDISPYEWHLKEGHSSNFHPLQKQQERYSVLRQMSKSKAKLYDKKENMKALQELVCHHVIGEIIIKSKQRFVNDNFRSIQINDFAAILNNLELLTSYNRAQMSELQLKTNQMVYKYFMEIYNGQKSKYARKPQQSIIRQIIRSLKALGEQIKAKFYQSGNPLKEFKKKVELLAGIVAVWAILNAKTIQGVVEYLFEPFPTQIITLILLLGISSSDEGLSNKLAQLGCGEGKSFVVAILASYLALVGFNVRCATSSNYLSSRDRDAFNTLFERLGIKSRIKYGFINELCDQILSDGENNFKEEVEKMILQPPQGFFQKISNALGFNTTSFTRKHNEIIHNPTILLIDNVDTYFDDCYLGKMYIPTINLRGSAINAFIEYVWRVVQVQGKKTNASSLIKSKQFEQLCNRYPTLKDLLKDQVNEMVKGALNYKHDYQIANKSICYRTNESNLNHYKTAFAYIFEYSQCRVEKSHRDNALQIRLKVGEFSYAELPNYFANMIGISSTLEALPQYKKQQLWTRYRINTIYAIPSVFGASRQLIEQYHFVQITSYNQKIVKLIHNIRDGRPIIIFFKGSSELNQFFECSQFQPFLKRSCFLSEQTKNLMSSIISEATQPNKITLTTIQFSKGIDFIVNKDKIKENGGLHIIQTFLSLDESQQICIKGRTARQNKQGSFDCLFDDAVLKLLDIDFSQIRKISNLQDFSKMVFKSRKRLRENKSQQIKRITQSAVKKHENMAAIFYRYKLGQGDLINYITKINIPTELEKDAITTVLGFDGNCWMGEAIKLTSEVISPVFERAKAVLESTNLNIQIYFKIIVFRSYSCSAGQIIKSTDFENNPSNLTKFLKGVDSRGGIGAFEVFFKKLNGRTQKSDQVILMGSAAPDDPAETATKPAEKDQKYWSDHGFYPTNLQRQLELFKRKNCPVHCIYLPGGEKLTRISRQTGGNVCRFNLHSGRTAEDMTQFIVESLLSRIEQKQGKVRLGLVEAYRKMFIK